MFMTRQFIVTAVLTMLSLTIQAQTKQKEHQVFASVGLLVNRDNGVTETGLSARIGYGLNCYLSDKVSVMPAIALRQAAAYPFTSKDGEDTDGFLFLDVPIALQYHFSGVGNGWSVSFGPVFSYCLDNDRYYIDASPDDPRNDMDKIRNFDFALQPGVHYRVGRFRLGVESRVGVFNIKNTNAIVTGTKRLYDVVASVYYRF